MSDRQVKLIKKLSSEKVGEFVSICQRRKTWYINYQYEGKQFRRSLKTQNKKEARRRALITEREILANRHKHCKKPLFIKEVVEKYLAHLQAEGRSKKTVTKYKFCFSLLLDLAKRKKTSRISQIDLSFMDTFRSERAAGAESLKPSSPKTINNDTIIVRQLINFALRRSLVEEDPLKGLRIKKPPRTPQPCWTRDEVERILEAACASPYRDTFIFLAETGARIGEAIWLTWKDIDFNNKMIHIRPKEGWKTKSGQERAVPMSKRLQEMLVQKQQIATWVFTPRKTKRHPWVDRQISDRRLLENLKRILKLLDLKGHTHTFRHSFISHAAIQGISERVLRTWIGHVDRNILDWYFHLADQQSRDAMRMLSRSQISSSDIEKEKSF